VSTPHPLIHLSVTKKFVFGIDGKSNIYSYSIAANGGLKYVASIDAAKYVKDASSTSSAPVLQVDETGSDVYAFVTDTNNNWYLLSFKIESNGELDSWGAPTRTRISRRSGLCKTISMRSTRVATLRFCAWGPSPK
jgi:hypothetical protein